MTRLACLLAVAGCSFVGFVRAGEIGWIEEFALAEDRTAALRQLVPGTEDYYYYYCLHYQNTAQWEKVDETLAAWIRRYNHTPRVIEIENRQALLNYERDPKRALDLIIQRLTLRFDHERERLDPAANLPTSLDPTLLDRQRLIDLAFSTTPGTTEGFEDAAIESLLDLPLTPDQRRHLLSRLRRPDHPKLVEAIVADLKHPHSGGFGQFEIHRQLLLAQLDELLKLMPELRNQQNFVNTYLQKLHPSADANWRQNKPELKAYLERMWAFASTLEPVHNSLKTHVLYQRLVLDRSEGVYDRDRFLTYLKLPRLVTYLAPALRDSDQRRRWPANLEADFGAVTMFPPIGVDEPLVRSYLEHFFVEADDYKAFLPYINDVYLKQVFAETKIVNGLGDVERWASMLPPAQYQQLKERVDLEFGFTNRTRFAPDEAVGLDLFVKNVDTLLVKVFEIDAGSYYRKFGREVGPDVDLDGLVANHEQTYDYDEPPLRRVRRHFEFPQLKQRGVYVIDVIGNGMSSRAVVRKGQLSYLVRTGAAGQVFTILDEQRKPVPKATLWLAGTLYTADENGTLVTPFSNNPQTLPVVLGTGKFSSLDRVTQQAENYTLTAGIYVDREELLSLRSARVTIRPSLSIAGTPVSVQRLEEPRLVITSTDLDGLPTTKEVGDFKLSDSEASVYEFQVPPRLANVSFTLAAKLQVHSKNEKIDLHVQRSFSVNEIDKTERIEDVHLVHANGNYFVDLLGKSGEVQPGRAVNVDLKLRDFRQPVHATFATDAGGRVTLGTLPGVETITASGPDGVQKTWPVRHDEHTYHSAIHGTAGKTITVPYMGTADKPLRSELSLLEYRSETFFVDRFDALTIKDGMLVINDLPAGDYSLRLKGQGTEMRLRLTEGPVRSGYVLGEHRRLEQRHPNPLQIVPVELAEEKVRIRVVNPTKSTRVHIYATRFVPAFPACASLASIVRRDPSLRTVPKAESLYVVGRNIGDEYRYVIDRRFSKKYPGNMLERPELLLNPWIVHDTATGQQTPQEGGAFAPAAQPPSAATSAGSSESAPVPTLADPSNLDFLAETSIVLPNLVPDKDGVIEFDRKDLGPHQDVVVVAADGEQSVSRQFTLDEVRAKPLDLRLADSLDPAKHFMRQRRISIIDKGEQLVFADVAGTRFEIYDSLDRVMALYAALNPDPKLAEFRFLANWPSLPPEKKRELYSKYASHELHLFLYEKDAEFFAQAVKPYLANKLDKTFVDEWLLDRDLEAYLEPWRFGRLNTLERILLGQRIEGERDGMSRAVREQFDLLPPQEDRDDVLFQTALLGRALEAASASGVVRFGIEAEDSGRSDYFSRQLGRQFGGVGGGMGGMPGPASGTLPALDAASQPADESAAESQSEAMDDRANGLRKSLSRRGGVIPKFSDGTVQEHLETDMLRLAEVRQLYVLLDKTKEWAENNYYHVPNLAQTPALIPVGKFWVGYASHDTAKPFRSPDLADATHTFPEMLTALALLDLPFAPEQHDFKLDAGKLTIAAGSPMVVYHEEVLPAEMAADGTPVLVNQNFFRHGDRYRHEGNVQVDKFVTDEFLVDVVYGCQVVVTNPTSTRRKLDLLLQVPRGAVPVLNGRHTKGVRLDLEPYHTQVVEYHFYFPAAGDYPHYPVQVSDTEQVLKAAEPFTFHVVAKPSKIDTGSWAYISQHGTPEEVVEFLKQHNLLRLDLDKIAFRMQDAGFFAKVVELLASRHVYNQTLWSYGVKHNHVEAIREFLRHADAFVAQTGEALRSPLLVIDPVLRKTYEHLEYAPLVNARVMQLGRNREILNDRFLAQYHRLLKILSYRRQLDDDELMEVTYYLLLQDRIGESIATFGRVNAQSLDTRLQYDYFTAYLDFYESEPEAAREIAAKYVDYPVDRWRNEFANIVAQADEITKGEGAVVDPEDRTQVQTGRAAKTPSFEFTIDAGTVRLTYQNLDAVTVNYYLMDVELLFSRNPFVQDYGERFSFIRPNQTQAVKLPADKSVFTFELPEELRRANVLVEIDAAGKSQSKAYYANSLRTQIIEDYGQLRVTDAEGQPLPKVYVKTYARMKDGNVRFYKDGYTDLRGRFDYTSLSTSELEQVDRFSLLVLSEDHGAIVREAGPPPR
ncbi:MAG: hypothetical protein WBC44_20390 [Planctomycetaceae bacterium]